MAQSVQMPGLCTTLRLITRNISLCFLSAAAAYCQTGRIHPKVGSSTTFMDKVIPLVTVGDGWSQRIVLQNVDSTYPAVGKITFFAANGDLLMMNMRGIGQSSLFTFNIPAGRTFVFDTVASSAPLQIGWALLEANSAGLGDLFGQMIFRKQTPGRPDFMCSMVLGRQGFRKISTFFDNTGGNVTGMGIVTSEDCTVFCSDSPASLRVTVRDIAGMVISQKTISQKHGTLYWMNLAIDFPETNRKAGTFEVEVIDAYSTNLTGMSLQFAGNGAFTAITPFED